MTLMAPYLNRLKASCTIPIQCTNWHTFEMLLLIFLLALPSSFSWQLKREDRVTYDRSNKYQPQLVLAILEGTLYTENLSNITDPSELWITDSILDTIENGALCSSPFHTIRLTQNTYLPTLAKEMFGDCPSLESLVLGTNVSSWSLTKDALSNLKNLARLKIHHFDDIARVAMQSLPALRELVWTDSNLPTVDVSVFTWRNLRQLYLKNDQIAELQGRFSMAVEVLDVSQNPLEEFPWEMFRLYPSLTWLALSKTNVRYYDVDDIAQYAPKLKTLYLSKYPVECSERENLVTRLRSKLGYPVAVSLGC